MYLKCSRGLDSPPSIRRYQLPEFSSVSGGLSRGGQPQRYSTRVTVASSTQRYYSISLSGQEKRKDMKAWKSRSEEKVLGFSSCSLLPTRKRDAVTHPRWNQRIDYLTRRTLEAGMAKAGKTSETAYIPIHHTRIIRAWAT